MTYYTLSQRMQRRFSYRKHDDLSICGDPWVEYKTHGSIKRTEVAKVANMWLIKVSTSRQ